jgi:preprotein translocase subunit SecD
MRTLLKKPIIIFWIILVLSSILLLSTIGLKFGVDFSGGTAFQVILEKPVATDELSQAASILGRRLDWSGSKDARVTPSGNQYISIQIAESDPAEIASLKSALLQQGNFEAVLDGNILFSGDDIRTIYKDPSRGYGITEITKGVDYQWALPFLLSPDAAKRFAEMTFHKCTPTGFAGDTSDDAYDCEKTYFFIDRPKDAIILIDKITYLDEKEVPLIPGIYSSSFPIEDLFDQLNVPYYIVDNNLTDNELASLTSDFNSYSKIILSPNISSEIKSKLDEIGFRQINILKQENVPWIWDATGLKSVISITSGIANMDVSTMESSRFKTFSELHVTGRADSYESSQARLDDLLLVLESGSLPIAIESISTESISPYLGKDFLKTSLLIGIFALLTVALVLFIRYRYFSLAAPILLTGTTEILILLGLLSLMHFRLDLAAVAGILATIGTGVDDNIIIIDELLRGHKKEDREHHESLLKKVKKAFFIMFAAAATSAATMFPIIFFSLGLGKLVGFAVTILLGTAIGIFVVRPVYAQIAQRMISKDHK